MPVRRKRLTLQDARRLYPNEWVVFVDPKIDEETTSFVDGVVLFHCKDQEEAYRRSASLKGARAKFFTGSIPYRGVVLQTSDEIDKKAA
jgi:hypothetical protein